MSHLFLSSNCQYVQHETPCINCTTIDMANLVTGNYKRFFHFKVGTWKRTFVYISSKYVQLKLLHVPVYVFTTNYVYFLRLDEFVIQFCVSCKLFMLLILNWCYSVSINIFSHMYSHTQFKCLSTCITSHFYIHVYALMYCVSICMYIDQFWYKHALCVYLHV